MSGRTDVQTEYFKCTHNSLHPKPRKISLVLCLSTVAEKQLIMNNFKWAYLRGLRHLRA